MGEFGTLVSLATIKTPPLLKAAISLGQLPSLAFLEYCRSFIVTHRINTPDVTVAHRSYELCARGPLCSDVVGLHNPSPAKMWINKSCPFKLWQILHHAPHQLRCVTGWEDHAEPTLRWLDDP